MMLRVLTVSGMLLAQAEPAPPVKECVPPCSPGYLCLDGTCVEACNPKCQPSERCTAERICVEKQTQTEQAVQTRAAGEGTVCTYRPRNPFGSALVFHLAVDDLRVALIHNNEYACRTVPSGTHRLTLSTPVAGMTWRSPSVTVEVKLSDGETVHFESAIGGGMAAPVMKLTPIDVGQATTFQSKQAQTDAR